MFGWLWRSFEWTVLSLCVSRFYCTANLHINALELLSVIVCLKLWGQRGRKICIQCDNMVSVQVINQGKSRSRFLQACLREICFICAIKECELRAIHIDGIENRLPDMLSRWSLSDSYSVQFYEAIEDSVTIGELSLSVDLHMLKTQAQESLKSAHASGTRKNLKIQKSNLVGTVDDSSKCLHRENISVFEDYLLVQFRWSKTIQFGERVLEIPIVKNLSSPLCAFSAFKAMCAKFPALASSPAFLVLSGRKTKPVSYNMLQNFLKNIVEKIGLDPTQYSSHSFRRGGATWAFQCGVSSELIQLQGDWKTLKRSKIRLFNYLKKKKQKRRSD
ncbi:unnamed protein product [Mytilus edulis]|uniref:Tyr recombinase domain-containing protein n=1 Tax=Mytilus edulis TaxID=6550 RepID=A0A8S3TJB3_MYTED|nr:unnamed protein product [Mytilus edulis]